MPDSSAKDRDKIAQEAVRSGANRSIAILEKAFIKNASGRYVVLKLDKNEPHPSGNEADPRKRTG